MLIIWQKNSLQTIIGEKKVDAKGGLNKYILHATKRSDKVLHDRLLFAYI